MVFESLSVHKQKIFGLEKQLYCEDDSKEKVVYHVLSCGGGGIKKGCNHNITFVLKNFTVKFTTK